MQIVTDNLFDELSDTLSHMIKLRLVQGLVL